MSDATVNVSGSDAIYAIDAVKVGGDPGDGDYRQVLVVGDFTNSGVAGSMATVSASALHVATKPGDSYFSVCSLNLSANGSLGSLATSEVMPAPGAGKKYVIYGVNCSTRGSGASSAATLYLHEGTVFPQGGSFFFSAAHIGKFSTSHNLMFSHGVALSTNTKVSITSEESATQVYTLATLYYQVVSE